MIIWKYNVIQKIIQARLCHHVKDYLKAGIKILLLKKIVS